MAFTDLVPVEYRSLEDRAHPLTFRDDEAGRRKIDGMSTGKLPQPRVFDINTQPAKLMAFGKLFAVDGVEFSYAAQVAGIHNYTAGKFIRASGLRAKKVQDFVAGQFEVFRDHKQQYAARSDSKWNFIRDALERLDRFAFTPDEPYSRSLRLSIYNYLNHCSALRQFKWSVRWDQPNEQVVVRRVGAWFVAYHRGKDRAWTP